MNTWFIVAQVLGVVAMVFEFVCYQIKDKTKYFLMTGIGSLFWALMFVSMGLATSMDTQLSLVLAGTYSTVRNLVFFGIFSKDTPGSKKAGRIFLLVMMVIGVVAGTMTVIQAPDQVRWLHVLGLVTALTFVVGQYLPGDHYVRITVVFYATVVLLTQTPLNILEGDFRWNVMGILIEASKIISVIVFYAIAANKKRMARELKYLKLELADEIAKLKETASKVPVSKLPVAVKIDKLIAKMIRYELKTIASSDIKDVASAELQTQGILDDLETVKSYKEILNAST